MTRTVLTFATVALVTLPGCWLPSHPIGIEMRNKTQFESEWRHYLALPPPKALAVAGDLNGVYVSGFANGTATNEEAIEKALHDCQQRRADRGIREGCRTYAVGDSARP